MNDRPARPETDTLFTVTRWAYRAAMDALCAVLIVDDDADVRHAARMALTPHVQIVETAASPQEMTEQAPLDRFDCVLLDMNFAAGDRSGRAGIDGLTQIKEADPALAVVLMTGYGGITLAVESLKRGAHDFLLKPWRNDALVAAVRDAGAHTRMARKGAPLDTVERATIKNALDRHGGNIAQAAHMLGLSRPALYRRKAKYGL